MILLKVTSDVKKRKIIKKLSNNENVAQLLNRSDKFRIETFNVIVDKLITELTKRHEAYNQITQLFGFLTNLLSIENKMEKKLKIL